MWSSDQGACFHGRKQPWSEEKIFKIGVFETPLETRQSVEKMLDLPTWIEDSEEETIELM